MKPFTDTFQTVWEWCATCDRETLHQVMVKVRTESPDTENAAFSREPYRIAECQTCGETTSQRMNNA